MNLNTKTIGTVERESYNLEAKTSIFPDALLKLHARDG